VDAEKKMSEEKKRSFWWQPTNVPSCNAPALKPGDICPSCTMGDLYYDGLFLLICPVCEKVAEGGAFT